MFYATLAIAFFLGMLIESQFHLLEKTLSTNK